MLQRTVTGLHDLMEVALNVGADIAMSLRFSCFLLALAVTQLDLFHIF